MLFSSLTFLYYFLPCVLLIYFLSPKKLKNSVLLISSLVFYGWGEPKFLVIMLLSILVNFVLGILIEKFSDKPLSKLFMAVSAVFSLGLLAYFKYANFFIENFSAVTKIPVSALNIALPIGISFYTFQILSYTIDVYRKNVKAQKNIITLGAYIALFPQLIAGPIVRYSDVERELNERTVSFEKASYGIRRFILGLSKKVILANTLGEFCSLFYQMESPPALYAWVFAFSYMLQVYFDFSGYSDMAIGLGKILGFNFMENFNYPFISKSISEFWRRWHISLGSWFRDYVYIPMGGNRVSKKRMLLNIFTVWFLTGFWHGAEWNFIIWGLYFAALLLIEKFYLKNMLEKFKVLSHIYVLFFVAVSFVIFSASGASEALRYVGALFGLSGGGLTFKMLFDIKNFLFVLLISAVFATPLFTNLKDRLYEKKAFRIIFDTLEIPVLLILLFVVTGYLADGSFNPFLYFRF